MNNFIAKAVAEFEEQFVGNPKHDDIVLDIEHFLTQKLEHLAKQKDEEFLGMIGEDEEYLHGIEYGVRGREGDACERCTVIRQKNLLKAELRNKLRGGKA